MEFDPGADYYEELEVSPSATPGTIEAAWRSLLKRHHPDMVGAEAGAAKAKRLNVAHDVLSDPVERRRYDHWRKERKRARKRERAEEPRAEQPRKPKGSASPGQGSPPAPPPGSARPGPESPPPPRPGSRPRPLKLRSDPSGRPYRGGPDYRRAGRAVLAGLAVIGVLRLAFSFAPDGSSAAARTPPPSLAVNGTVPVAPTEQSQSEAAATPPATAVVPTASASATRSPSREPTSPPTADPEAPRKGARNGGPWVIQVETGTYTASYKVDVKQGNSCSWELWVTDPDGTDILAASTYPVDTPDTSSETTTFDTAGASTMRVESDCPAWSFTLRRTGP